MVGTVKRAFAHPRHCERSKAIPRAAKEGWIASSLRSSQMTDNQFARPVPLAREARLARIKSII